jgi:hypothetical protein
MLYSELSLTSSSYEEHLPYHSAVHGTNASFLNNTAFHYFMSFCLPAIMLFLSHVENDWETC